MSFFRYPGTRGDPRGGQELYVWVAIDPQTGTQGICVIVLEGLPIPACSSSLDDIQRMRPKIEEGKSSGNRFILVRFSKREVLEEL